MYKLALSLFAMRLIKSSIEDKINDADFMTDVITMCLGDDCLTEAATCYGDDPDNTPTACGTTFTQLEVCIPLYMFTLGNGTPDDCLATAMDSWEDFFDC